MINKQSISISDFKMLWLFFNLIAAAILFFFGAKVLWLSLTMDVPGIDYMAGPGGLSMNEVPPFVAMVGMSIAGISAIWFTTTLSALDPPVPDPAPPSQADLQALPDPDLLSDS